MQTTEANPLRSMYAIFDNVPFAVVLLKGPSLVIEYINNYSLTIWQKEAAEVIGKPLFEARPDIRETAGPMHAWVYETGQRFKTDEVPFQLHRGNVLQTRYFNVIIDPLADESGRIFGQLAVSIEVTEQVVARKAVQEQEEQLRLITDSLPVLITYVDKEERYQFNNKSYEQWFGKSAADLKGKTINEVLGDKAYAFLSPVVKRALSGEALSFESAVPYKDGGERFIHADYIPKVTGSGEVTGYFAMITDITERKKQEAEMAYRKALLEAQNEAIPDAILVVDTKGEILSFNRRFVELWNIPDEILEAKDNTAALTYATTLAADPEELVKRVNECYAQPEKVAYDLVALKDGRIIERHGNAIIGEDGTSFGWIWHFRDVTDIKRKEEALQKSEDRYQNFIRQSSEGIWRFEVEEPIDITLSPTEQIELFFRHGYLAECNDSMARMYGFTNAGELEGTHLSQFFPRDSDTDAYFLHFIEAGYNVQNAESKEQDKNGNLKWFMNNLVGIVENGKLVRAWGTQRDITAEKTAEEKLRQSEEKYRSLFETMEQGFCIVEVIVDEALNPVDYRFVETNPVFAQQTGLHDVQGKTVRELLPDLEQRWLDIYGRVALTGKSVRFTEGADAMNRWFDVYAFRLGPADSRQVAILFSDVTERKQKENLLRESESRFRSMADEAPAFIFMGNSNAEIEFVNKTWIRFVGLSQKEALGQAWSAITHPDDVQRSYEIYNHAFQTRTSYQYEMRQCGTDGVYRWVLWKGIPRFLPNGEFLGILGIGFDITDSKIAEETVRQSEAHFRSLANAMPQVVWVAEPDGVVSYYNDRIEAFDGALRQGDGHWQWQGVLHDADRERTETAWKAAVAAGHVYQIEHRIRMKDGSYRWHLSRGIPQKNNTGDIIRWYGTATDIHEQKVFSEKLEQLIRERTHELQRSNEDLQQFAHVASHDLKEPVRKVMTFANRLQDELKHNLSDKAITYLSKIESSAIRMYSMIDGVLLYSSLNALEQTKESVDLNDLLQSILNDLEVPITQKAAQINYESLPVVTGSSILFYQLFYNLVNNALKFSKPDSSPVITVSSQAVTDEEAQRYDIDKGNLVRIDVQDNGIGFNVDDAEKIFGAFTRLHSKDQFEGTGLGLALCKKIVERHGGRIWATGKKGEGAVFSLLLPLE